MYRHICKYLYTFVHHSLVKCIEKQQQQQQQQQQRQQRQRQLVDINQITPRKAPCFIDHTQNLGIIGSCCQLCLPMQGMSLQSAAPQHSLDISNLWQEKKILSLSPTRSQVTRVPPTQSNPLHQEVACFEVDLFQLIKDGPEYWCYESSKYQGGNRMRHTTFLCQQVGEL